MHNLTYISLSKCDFKDSQKFQFQKNTLYNLREGLKKKYWNFPILPGWLGSEGPILQQKKCSNCLKWPNKSFKN